MNEQQQLVKVWHLFQQIATIENHGDPVLLSLFSDGSGKLKGLYNYSILVWSNLPHAINVLEEFALWQQLPIINLPEPNQYIVEDLMGLWEVFCEIKRTKDDDNSRTFAAPELLLSSSGSGCVLDIFNNKVVGWSSLAEGIEAIEEFLISRGQQHMNISKLLQLERQAKVAQKTFVDELKNSGYVTERYDDEVPFVIVAIHPDYFHQVNKLKGVSDGRFFRLDLKNWYHAQNPGVCFILEGVL